MITATDLFCGAGGSSLGAEATGKVKLAMAANHWETAIEVHQQHFPDAGHDCADVSQADPRRYPRTELLLASPECFPAGTLVTTDRGQIPIEEIEVGDLALTHLGRWRRVVRTQESPPQPTAVLKGQGHFGLELTASHKLPVRRQVQRWDPAAGQMRRHLQDESKLMASSLMEHKTRWSAPVEIEPLPLPDTIDFDAERWWMIGRYLADGYCDTRERRGGSVTISVGEHKLERDRGRLEALGFVGREVRTAWNFDLRNRELAEWLVEHFGHLAGGKKIPSWLLGRPEIAAHVLEGYVDGDGSVGPRTTTSTTVSKALAVGIKMLLTEQGYHVVFNRSPQTGTVIEGREVDVAPWLYNLRWENNRSQRTGITEDGRAWTLIKGFDPGSTESVPVYNIEVEEDHTYVAEGIAVCNCTNHSQARGVSRKRQDPTLWDEPDPAAERSRATMWDVPRFAEQMGYEAVIVENVVEATKWVGWRAWCIAMEDLGYTRHVLSINSMHTGVPQSRDRLYVVFVRNGIDVDLEMELDGWCDRCESWQPSRQAWKNERTVGRYRKQYVWRGIACGHVTEPAWVPASTIIDWDLPAPRVGDRKRPLAPKTRGRILAGLQRYGWAPVITAGAGNTHERTPGNRARPLSEPLAVQQATATHALAMPPEPFLVHTAHGDRARRPVELAEPHPTVTASDDRLSLVVPMRNNGHAYVTGDPLGTVTSGGNHHGLLVTNDHANRARQLIESMPTVTTGNRHGLLMRNNSGGAEMVTPLEETVRTVTTAGHQSLLLPYTSRARAVHEPAPTMTTVEDTAFLDPDEIVDDCGFRMLEPHEIARAMSFPDGYIPHALTKRDRVKLAGNAVTPPVMTWLTGRVVQALGG